MNSLQKALYLTNKVSKGSRFTSFNYTKPGHVGKRLINVNVNIAKTQAKNGKPLTGKGNWTTGNSAGPNGFLVQKDGKIYIKGYEKKGDKFEKFPKIFELDFVTNLK